eukprot:5362173-Pyramimonas_sp.AAC.1
MPCTAKQPTAFLEDADSSLERLNLQDCDIEFHFDLKIQVDVTMEHLLKSTYLKANVNCEPDEDMMCHETLELE